MSICEDGYSGSNEPNKKPAKVNVSLNPETMDALTKVREKLGVDLGFTPSYSQVIQHLIGKSRHGVGNSTNHEGDANE